jgi:hypothetical protein
MNQQNPVIGLDISRGAADIFVSFCPLTVPPRDFYESPEFDSCHFLLPIGSEMVDFLQSFSPKVVVMEPTGSYSGFLVAALEEREIPFLLVNQTMVRSSRKSFGGSDNKDDSFDSLLMAVVYYEKWERFFDRRFWVQHRHPSVRTMRSLLLDMRSATKKSGAARASLKQRLVRGEWIDKAKIQSDRRNGSLHPDRLPAFYAWLAQWVEEGDWKLPKSATSRWEREYQEALGRGDAMGISDATRSLARVICLHHQTEARLEQQLLKLLASSLFAPYHSIFNKFGFGQRERAWLLCRIYPFESFLSPEGEQVVDYTKSSTKKDKKTKKNRSKRRFRQALGVGRIQKSSGESQRSSHLSGSSEVRGILWTYVFCRIEASFDRQGKLRHRPNHFTSPELEELQAYFAAKAFPQTPGGEKVKLVGRKLADARNATCRRVAELLFRELAKIFVASDAAGGEEGDRE